MGKVSTSARCSRTIKLYESFPGEGSKVLLRDYRTLYGESSMTLRLVSEPVNGGEISAHHLPCRKDSKGERIERKRERGRGRLDAFPAPGQVNPLSSNIETNYRSPALVIIRLQINAFKLSAFSKLPRDSSPENMRSLPTSFSLASPCDGFAVSRENSR